MEERPMSEATDRPSLQVGELLGSAWTVFAKNVGILIGAYAVMAVILAGVNIVPLGGLATVVLMGPLLLGLVTLCMRFLRGEPADFGLLFSGFNNFLPAFLAQLVITIFTAIGLCLCIIPGLIVSALYSLTFYYMYDQKLDFWPAMEASRTTVMANPGAWAILLIVIYAMNLVGSIPCGLGTLVTMPLSFLMLGLAYERTKTPATAESAPNA